jgi:hypothetical protein
MTPKEKAEEIFEKINIYIPMDCNFTDTSKEVFDKIKKDYDITKKLSLIMVNEIIRLSNRPDLFLMMTKKQLLNGFIVDETYSEYWDNVKKEIEKL